MCECVFARECIGVCLSNNYAHRSGSPIVVPFLSAICVLFLFYFILFTNNFRLFFFRFLFVFCSSGVAIIFIHLFRHLMSCQCLDNASSQAHGLHFFAPISPAPSPFGSFFCSLSFRWKISMNTSSAARWAFSLHCWRIRMS